MFPSLMFLIFVAMSFEISIPESSETFNPIADQSKSALPFAFADVNLSTNVDKKGIGTSPSRAASLTSITSLCPNVRENPPGL